MNSKVGADTTRFGSVDSVPLREWTKGMKMKNGGILDKGCIFDLTRKIMVSPLIP